jgi:hypothetical protein
MPTRDYTAPTLSAALRIVAARQPTDGNAHSRPHAAAGATPITYVQLEGLGRVPFSNVRRPKPIMDLHTGPAPKAADNGGAPPHTPLEKEPALVRIAACPPPPPRCWLLCLALRLSLWEMLRTAGLGGRAWVW